MKPLASFSPPPQQRYLAVWYRGTRSSHATGRLRRGCFDVIKRHGAMIAWDRAALTVEKPWRQR